MDGAAAKPQAEVPGQVPTEVTAFVQGLLNQMQARFSKLSDNIISKIDDMGGRIDELEKGIADIIEQAAGEEPEGASSKK